MWEQKRLEFLFLSLLFFEQEARPSHDSEDGLGGVLEVKREAWHAIVPSGGDRAREVKTIVVLHKGPYHRDSVKFK